MSVRRHRETRIFKIIEKEASKRKSVNRWVTRHIKQKAKERRIRTPGARIGVVDGRINVPQVDFTHEAIDLIGRKGDGCQRRESENREIEIWTAL